MDEKEAPRDHRAIGKELDLFTFSELVGPGLPLWTPRGTVVREELDKFVWEMRSKHGYQRVTIPHITKKELYEKSGHWDKFAEDLFRITSREGKEYALKPMNCRTTRKSLTASRTATVRCPSATPRQRWCTATSKAASSAASPACSR